jgi:oxygen-independent coproporphyrinogen-3 oxidase
MPPAPRGAESTDPKDPRAPDGTPLYVHLPFCAAKCRYCDFFSVAAEGQDRAAMVEAILAEAAQRAPRKPSTVYVGGGTPSLLDAGELRRLLDELDRLCGFRASASEVTAECNPESLDRDKARALLDLGVNRLSIGLQSLHDDVLLLFGRVHSAADGLRAFDAARSAGATNVNVDLIYAVPDQDPEVWRSDLERVLDLQPDHLSAYNLTFEEETLFRRWLEEGRLRKSSEDLELELFHATRDTLAARGFEAYEISNFATSGRRCEHNVNYWRNGTYLGLGPSAVSKLGHRRTGNRKGTTSYVRTIRESGHAREWEEELDTRQRLAETWWLGLRLHEGVDPADARRTAGIDELEDPAIPIAQELATMGLLEEREGRHRLTPKGLPLADWVAKRVLERLGA